MALASLYEIFLGYSALFLCIGFGILFLAKRTGGVGINMYDPAIAASLGVDG